MNLKKTADYGLGEEIFKEYTLSRFVGEGGFGRVYLVENKVGLPYALKVLHKDVEMEQRGIESVMRIRSSRLVSILDYGETVEGEACVLMEYVKDSLEDAIAWGKTGEQKAVGYFKEILKGLAVLEENGIIHRDLKPENLFVLDDIVKIGDFGTAKFTSGESSTMSKAAGTFHYMSPERFKKGYGYSSVDRWAASVIFYRVLTGGFPFDGDDNTEIFGSIMMSEPEMKKVPVGYRDFLGRCFEKDPGKRHKSAVEMLDALTQSASSGPKRDGVSPPPPPPFLDAEKSSSIINSIGMSFVWIPPGTFVMGSPEDEADRSYDELQHQVTLTKGFYLQTTPVTQGQWKKVMGNNPSYFQDGGDDCPVEQVSWDDCQGFIRKLNGMEGKNIYRLPTEAQWEYSCRAGSSTRFCFGDYDGGLGEYAWYDKNSDDKTHSVGQKKPNAWGLYDMHGNVYEWCQDWYGDYPKVPVTDPTGPTKGGFRVLRGGGWRGDAGNCRSADRINFSPDSRYGGLGFRLLRS